MQQKTCIFIQDLTCTVVTHPSRKRLRCWAALSTHSDRQPRSPLARVHLHYFTSGASPDRLVPTHKSIQSNIAQQHTNGLVHRDVYANGCQTLFQALQKPCSFLTLLGFLTAPARWVLSNSEVAKVKGELAHDAEVAVRQYDCTAIFIHA